MGSDEASGVPGEVLAELRRTAEARDQSGEWPGRELELLAGSWLMKAAVGREWGGDGKAALAQHQIYESVARASLAVSLILSQRDAAVGLIEASQSPLRGELLPRLARGEIFSTVGIAQLTTSRQGGAPALRARETAEGGYRVDGLIPWCTGAAKAEYIVAGAATEEGRHVLMLLPRATPGVRVDPPMPLVALGSTWTASIHCQDVVIGPDLVLRTGERVLARPNHLPLGQAYLAMGLCRGAIDLIGEFNSPAAEKARDRLDAQLTRLGREVVRLSQADAEAEANELGPAIRGQCNDLALRAAHAAVTLYKGTGLLSGHPAQRLAREALFLLVWSCPSPVIDCTVELLTEPPGGWCDA